MFNKKRGVGPDWVSAGATHNYVIDDPLGDYLDQYAEQAGFQPDHAVAGYDPRFDWVSRMIKQSWAFERKVVEWLSARFPVQVIATDPAQAVWREKMEATIAAMRQGVEIIAQGVLWNGRDRIHGVSDLLVRSDILASLCPTAFAREPAGAPGVAAPQLPGGPHYRAVDAKFATLTLLRNGRAHLAYMAQNWAHHVALGQAQGYTPPASYLMGRDHFDRAGRVPHDDPGLRRLVAQAAAWLRHVRREGAGWKVLSSPTIPELRPTRCCS